MTWHAHKGTNWFNEEKLLEYKAQGILITMGTKVLVSFTLGWIFLALSQFLEYQSLKNKNVPLTSGSIPASQG